MKSRASRIRSRWFCTALLVPMGMAVRVPVPDSLVTSDEAVEVPETRTTTFSFAGGGGTRFREVWVTLGYDECTGGPIQTPLEVEEEFAEIGGAIDHQASDHVHIGARAGYVWGNNSYVGSYDTTITDLSGDRDFFHLDPYVSGEWHYFGVGVGGIFAGKALPSGGSEDYPLDDGGGVSLSGHLRVGSLSGVYGSVHLWEGVPLYTGGQVSAGVGVRPLRPLELYGGYSWEGPYQTEAWMGKITADVSPAWSIYATGRFLENWNGYGDERGVSVGLSYRLVR
jgi:hypothetical protein